MPHARRSTRTATSRHRKTPEEPMLSRLRCPDGMSLEDWQIRLRRQFGRGQVFLVENLGTERIFSEFAVTNSDTKGRYRVAIRGAALGENFCSCPDFATNDIGTCKHIEFTLARLEAKRGGKTALKRGFHSPYSEVYLSYGGARSVHFRAGTDCPSALALRARKLFGEEGAGGLPPTDFVQLDAFLKASQGVRHEVRCYDDALAFIAAVRDSEERCRVIDSAYPQGSRSKALTKLLKTKLYPYQVEGALFAVRAGRVLIGDEMGLGKTIQAIAAAELFARHFGVERVLIICPASLKHQWHREITRFSARMVQVIRGPRASRLRQYGEDGFCKITTYENVSRDLDVVNAWSPDLVIVDEAQRIKNWNTIAARALKRIVSPYAVVLTGTPLENRLEELVSIIQFVDQNRLGPTWRLLHEHQMRDETGRVIGYRNLDRIGTTLAPIMLRRKKSDVLKQLPERVDNNFFVPMTSEQRVYHDENGERVSRIVKRWRRTGYLSETDQRVLTCALQNMRMSCNSTYLLDHETDYGVKADELAILLAELFEKPEAKVVIFSQWVRTHELIIRRLQDKGWGYVLFHGGIPSDNRGALVDRFLQDPDCRVFLSTDAGGVGLNLQHAASTVINMDLPWNPAVLEQRIGRVHRLGQKNSVQVVNFIAEGTIEEGMLSVLAFKKSLFAGVLDGGENEVFLHGTPLSRFMDSVDQVTGAMGEGDIVADTTPPVEAGAAPMSSQSEDLEDESVTFSQEASPVAQVADTTPAATNPWVPLIDVGLQFLESFKTVSSVDTPAAFPDVRSWMETDPRTGKSSIRLPVPDPETLQGLAHALSGLLTRLR